MSIALQVATQFLLQVTDLLVAYQIGFTEDRNNIGQRSQVTDLCNVLVASPF